MEEIFTVHIGVFVFSVLLTVIGLTWTLICLLFVIVYRNSKYTFWNTKYTIEMMFFFVLGLFV